MGAVVPSSDPLIGGPSLEGLPGGSKPPRMEQPCPQALDSSQYSGGSPGHFWISFRIILFFSQSIAHIRASQVAVVVKNLPASAGDARDAESKEELKSLLMKEESEKLA